MDELEFHPENYYPGDSTLQIPGLEGYVENLKHAYPEELGPSQQQLLQQRFDQEGQLSEADKTAFTEQPGFQESSITGNKPSEFESEASDEIVQPPLQQQPPQPASFPIGPDGRIPAEALVNKDGTPYRPETIGRFNLTLPYLAKEGEIFANHQAAGGDNNLESTYQTFMAIRNDPELVARYDRNGDGQYSFSDWFDVQLDPEQDAAMTAKWLQALQDKSLTARGVGFFNQFMFEGALLRLPGNINIGTMDYNMARFSHTRRKHALADHKKVDMGESYRQNSVAGMMELTKQLISTPERIGEAVRTGDASALWTHDAKIDDYLLGTNDPTSLGSALMDPIQRVTGDGVAYELGYWAIPTIATWGVGSLASGTLRATALHGYKFLPKPVAAALMRTSRFVNPDNAWKGGKAVLTKNGWKYVGQGPGLWGKFKTVTTAGLRGGLSTTLEVVPFALFRDYSIKTQGMLYKDPKNTMLGSLVNKYPNLRIAGFNYSAGLNSPLGKQIAYTFDEMATDFMFAGGLISVFKGGSSIIGGLLPGTKFAKKNLKQLAVSTKSWSTDRILEPDYEWNVRQQKLNDKAEAAKSQMDIDLDGPSSPWRDNNATDVELSSTYGAYKNGAVFPGQAISPTRGSVLDVLNDLDEIDGNVTIEGGSTDSLFTPLQIRKMADAGIDDATRIRLGQELLDSPIYKEQIAALPKTKQTLVNMHESALRRIQEIEGRDAASLSPREYFGNYIADQDLNGISLTSITNLQVIDAVNNSLLLNLRDMAAAAGEMAGKTDIFATNGPAKRIADTLVVGLSEVKRTRYMWGLLGRMLNDRGGKLTSEMLEEITADVAKRTNELHSETQDGVRMMMKMLENNDSDELATGILEVFKMSNRIHNWKDFDAWMRQKIKGGEFEGKVKTGVMIRELQGVMVNSILSGPKTPLRAILGTTTNAYYNALNEAAGALVRAPFGGDLVSRRASLAKLKGMFELIPEAFSIFRKNLDSSFSADFANIRTRYSEAPSLADEQWELYGEWAAKRGTDGDKAAYYTANTARTLNNNKILGWSPRVMAATDDTFKWLLARTRSKEKGLRAVIDDLGDELGEITPEMMRKAEDIHMQNFLDPEGNIDLSKDSWLKKQFEEITLTTELKGWAEKLDTFMNSYPIFKPFYLFARTGINGLNLSFKNTPLLGVMHRESLDILGHQGDDFSGLMKYGIENAEDLANARNLFAGRQAVGAAVVGGISQKYLSGELTGNGPADKQLKQNWINAGWKPNHIYFGQVGFNYASLEPFNVIFSAIADIGDNIELMGSEWAENRLAAVAFVMGRGLTGKTYMSGIDQMMQLVQMKPWAFNKAVANILNNSIPLAGMRNEFGKFLNPHMKELNSSAWASIRNRNQSTELIASVTGLKPLSEKKDLLNGKPINNWNFVGRAFNAVSPIQIDYRSKSPGRNLLLDSNYDLKSTTYSFNGYSFVKHAEIRSHFQGAIGSVPITIGHKTFKNVEEALNYLAGRDDVKKSMAKMKADSQNPANWDIDPNTYPHNTLINLVFTQARRKAWAVINSPTHPGYPLIEQLKSEKMLRTSKTQDNRNEILGLNNPQPRVPTFPKLKN